MKRTIFKAARIHALNQRTAAGDALLVEDGRIVDVAGIDELRNEVPGAQIIDLGDTTITPGLTDSHIHITEWAVARRQLDLSNAASISEAAGAVAAAPQAHGGWVMGRGWNAHKWGGTYPSRAALDRIAPDVPVVLQSHDMHALWLNSRALALTGIAERADDPSGGRILRDEHGAPTGVLLERAAELVVPHLPQYDLEAMLVIVLDAQRELHRFGITAIHSLPGIHIREPDAMLVLEALDDRALLRLRVLQHLPLDGLEDAIAAGLRSGFGNEWLRVGAVKMFLDGALGSRTALMLQPYEGTNDCGVEVMPEAEFRDTVTRAAENGIASVVHAIGDAAVQRAFAVLNEAAPAALPHRVEHVQCLPPSSNLSPHSSFLTPRVICSVQPSHLMTDWPAANQHWGARGALTYAFRYMLDQGAIIACGSDAPVESADPRHGLYAAVTRTNLQGEPKGGWHAEQRITALEALTGYTIGPALAAGVPSDYTGIAPGALADFVAWRQDPLNINPDELLKLEPAATIVAGEVVHES